jgi:hypothetical protein
VDGVYRLYEETGNAAEKILNALRDHGSVKGPTQLVRLAGVRKQAGLETVRALIGSGAIIDAGHSLRAGSAKFPEQGTTQEPHREPRSKSGSHFVDPHLTETGTDTPELNLPRFGTPIPVGTGTARPTRIENDKVQELVPLARGDEWRDVEEFVA